MQHTSRCQESAGRFQASRCARASAMPGIASAGLRGPVGGACARARRKLWALLALLATLSGAAGQDSRSVRRTEVEQRRALLIGNAAYEHVRVLQNTLADVEALEGALRELGFEVTVERDRGVNEMDRDLTKFAESLGPRDLAFFYFSGHGVAVGGENYLLPVDFPGSGYSTRRTALAAAEVQKKLEDEAQVRVLVLDACRDNPIGDRSTGGGLAKMNGAEGTLIAYATGAGNVASDNRAGELGLYMTHLVRELRKPGAVELGAVFDETQASVYAASKLAHPGRDAQNPEISDKVIGNVYLRGGPVNDRPVEGRWVRDWQALKDIEDPALKGAVEKYIEKYKDEAEADVWVAAAVVLLAELEKMARTAGSPWTSPSGMEFAWIPAGRFVMGSPEDEEGRDDDEVQRGVRISEGFWMGRYEVTQEEWEAGIGFKPSRFSECGSRCPVETVSWDHVQVFIDSLNERESGNGYMYRLPTEAEWEYAARAGSAGATPEGDLRILGERNAPVLDVQAWYGGNSGVSYEGDGDCSAWEEKQYEAERCGPHPVGQKRANGWGLHDMLGNVWEWTADGYGHGRTGFDLVPDPTGPYRVARGGGWSGPARSIRSANRTFQVPGQHLRDIGFRLVMYLRGDPVVGLSPEGWKRDWEALESIEDPALKGAVEKYIEKYKNEAEADVWVEKAKGLLAQLEKIAVGTDGSAGAGGPGSSRVLAAGSSWKSPLGMEFAWVPAGRFVMGSPEGEKGREANEVQHEVRISRGFWMGRYEVTLGEWIAVKTDPSVFPLCGPRCPVVKVSWFEVQEFIRALNERESGNGYEYRLPTEAEWEYAARAGTTGATPEGELRSLGANNVPVLDGQAWYGGNSGVTYGLSYGCSAWGEKQYEAESCGPHPVGQKRANGWGLHDMLGNVWEWTADRYGYYPSGLVTGPRGPSTGSLQVVRGGGWGSSAGDVRSANRNAYGPGVRSFYIGFRLVRTE